mgnify:CR=1 FL=1
MKKLFILSVVLIIHVLAPYILFSQTTGNASSNPLATFPSKYFSGSRNCAICHTNLVDRSGKDVSIDSDWRSTMMANAARDSFWQAKVQTEIIRTPSLKKTIEKKCSTCHMPMAYTPSLFEQKEPFIFENGFLNLMNAIK